MSFAGGRLIFSNAAVDSYVASVTADFLRQKLLAAKKSLTIETVMSHPGKVELLKTAQELGYRTYLYFIATEDPAINVSRVASRVRQGGHPVPEDKIVKRYHASLNLLIDAIRHTNRAYLFDNSRHHRTWLAEVTNGRLLEMKTGLMPSWFKSAVWDKINLGTP
jgi:predicted ABC-type ATPase